MREGALPGLQVTYDRLQATLRALGSVESQPQPGGDLAQAIFDGRPFPTPPQPRQWTALNKGAAPVRVQSFSSSVRYTFKSFPHRRQILANAALAPRERCDVPAVMSTMCVARPMAHHSARACVY